MIRINKHILLFLGTTLFVSFPLFVIGEKVPYLFSHDALYYCQSTIFPFISQISPFWILLPFLLLGVFAVFALTKSLSTFIAIQTWQKKLLGKRIEDAKFTNLLSRLNLKNKAFLIEDNKPFAFCLGLFRPRIYISTVLLQVVDKKELEAILRHEEYHLKSKDSLTMIIGSFGKTLFPFFPIFSDFIKHYRIEREIKADKEAVLKTGSNLFLVSALKKLLLNPSLSSELAPSITGHDTLEPRIGALTNNHTLGASEYKKLNVLISVAFLGAIFYMMFGPLHLMHAHSGDNHHILVAHTGGDTCSELSKEINIHPSN
jgi:beta-lactamase regulating signal transducer with metallopeptidase domain